MELAAATPAFPGTANKKKPPGGFPGGFQVADNAAPPGNATGQAAVQMNSLMRFSRNSWRPLTLPVTSPFLSM